MDQITVLVCSTLHWVSPTGRAVIAALADCGGAFGTAPFLASRLGFRDRHQLARLLAYEDLPPLQELAAWIRVLGWLLEWEQRGTALCRLALRRGADPAAYYHTVNRLTGLSWSEVRGRGVAWVLWQLREQCEAARVRLHLTVPITRGASEA